MTTMAPHIAHHVTTGACNVRLTSPTKQEGRNTRLSKREASNRNIISGLELVHQPTLPTPLIAVHNDGLSVRSVRPMHVLRMPKQKTGVPLLNNFNGTIFC